MYSQKQATCTHQKDEGSSGVWFLTPYFLPIKGLGREFQFSADQLEVGFCWSPTLEILLLPQTCWDTAHLVGRDGWSEDQVISPYSTLLGLNRIRKEWRALSPPFYKEGLKIIALDLTYLEGDERKEVFLLERLKTLPLTLPILEQREEKWAFSPLSFAASLCSCNQLWIHFWSTGSCKFGWRLFDLTDTIQIYS